jgi:hypothetical protein
MATEQEVKTALKKITDEYWDARKTPILLSQLPEKLEAEVPDYKEVLVGKSLKAFAQAVGEDSGFKLITHPSQRAKLGLVPANVGFEFPKEAVTQQGVTTPAGGQEGTRDRGSRSQEPVLALLRILSGLPPEELEKVVIPVSTLVKLLK